MNVNQKENSKKIEINSFGSLITMGSFCNNKVKNKKIKIAFLKKMKKRKILLII
jgi:hypothetical protein